MHPGGGDNHTVGRVPQKIEKGHLFCNLYREWQNTKHRARLQVAEEFVQAKPPPKWALRGQNRDFEQTNCAQRHCFATADRLIEDAGLLPG